VCVSLACLCLSHLRSKEPSLMLKTESEEEEKTMH
jgi:hypothetical protein